MINNHGGKRENSGRKKDGRNRAKTKTFFLSDKEIEKINKVLKKIKNEHSYKYDVEAFLHLIDYYDRKGEII